MTARIKVGMRGRLPVTTAFVPNMPINNQFGMPRMKPDIIGKKIYLNLLILPLNVILIHAGNLSMILSPFSVEFAAGLLVLEFINFRVHDFKVLFKISDSPIIIMRFH